MNNNNNSICTVVQNEQINELLTILEENKIDKNEKGKALLLACKGTKLVHIEMAKILIQSNADVNTIDTNFVTPLIAACKNENTDFIEVINMLINFGADLNAQEDIYVCKYSSLYHAVQKENFKLVEMLLKAGANVNIVDNDLITPLLIATKKDNFEIAALLIKYGANINLQEVDYKTPLHYSVQKRNIKLTELLIQSGADVNKMDYERMTPLFSLYQSTDKCTKLAKMLIKAGAQINDFNNRNALHYAANGGNADLAKLIIKSKSEVNVQCLKKQWTPLHYAADKANLQVIKLLLNAKSDVNITDKDQATPLIILSRSLHYPYRADTYVNIAKLLLESGANINAVNNKNCSALFYASKKGNLQLINLLISFGANANIKSITDQFPLMLLTKFNFENTPDWFDKLVCETKDLNLSRSTILIEMAAQTSNIEILQILIKHGANVNFCYENKMTIDSLISSYNVTVELFNFIWNLTDKNIFKKTHDISKFLIDIIRNKWYRDKIVCVYSVIDIIDNLKNTPLILYEIALKEFYMQDNYEIFSDFEYYNYEEYKYDVIFHSKDLYIDNDYLNIDILGITKKMFEKNAKFDTDKKNMEGLIYLCCKYEILNAPTKSLELITFFVNNNVNFNNNHLLEFTTINHPSLSLYLLKYSIVSNPVDIFKCICQTSRRDIHFLNLIKNILTIYTPCEHLRLKCISHLKNVKLSFRYVGHYDFFHDPLYSCVKHCRTDDDREKEQNMFDFILKLLEYQRVPGLQEICRNVIRNSLGKNCCSTYDFLNSLDLLYLPKLVKDIIQCQYALYSI